MNPPYRSPNLGIIHLKFIFVDVLASFPRKRLSRNYLRRNGGDVIVDVLISFHSRDVSSALLAVLLFGRALPLFRCSFGCYYLAVYSVF